MMLFALWCPPSHFPTYRCLIGVVARTAILGEHTLTVLMRPLSLAVCKIYKRTDAWAWAFAHDQSRKPLPIPITWILMSSLTLAVAH